MPSFNEKVLRDIPAEVFMISSSQDNQISHEAYNTSEFELPDPAGKKGGACTSAILNVLYTRGHEIGKMSWVDVLKDMHEQLKEMKFDQIPQLSSSRWIDVNWPMFIVPPKSSRRRAMLIGVNYVGQKGELTACHNDCSNLRDYLIKAQGFRPEEMLVLMDDGKHSLPTKQNIMDGFVRLTQYSQPGDVIFVSFSGHGGRVVDTSGDEDDGYDESLIPLDFRENGQIVDDDILKYFVKRLKKGVTCTVVMDCCHSGTVMDLPYNFPADAETMQIEKNFQFDDTVVKAKKKIPEEELEQKRVVKSIREQPMKPPPVRMAYELEQTPPPPPAQCCVIQ